MRRTLLLLVGLIGLLASQTPASASAPNYHQATETGWTTVQSAWPDQTYWNGSFTSDGRAQVGYQGWSAPDTLARSYFKFDTNPLQGKRILRAELAFTNSFSAACTAVPIDLWGATAITPQTTWNNQPQRVQVGRQYVPGGGGQCGPAQQVYFDATSYVQHVVNTSAPDVTFGLTSDEFNRTAYRKFDTSSNGNRPQLLITYE